MLAKMGEEEDEEEDDDDDENGAEDGVQQRRVACATTTVPPALRQALASTRAGTRPPRKRGCVFGRRLVLRRQRARYLEVVQQVE